MMRSFFALLACDTRYRKWEFHLAFLLYLAVLVLGSIPGARAEIGELASGLVLHVLTYCTITLLLFRGGSGTPAQKAIRAFLIVAAMGAGDEALQSLFSYRTASLIDWLVDINAAFFTSAFMWYVWNRENSGLAKPR